MSAEGVAENTSDTARIAYYVRLAGIFRYHIRVGEWKSGQQLPTIPTLCDRYGVARSTVRQALQLLISDGLLTSTRGKGTFVKERAAKSSGTDTDLRDAISDPLETGPHETMKLLERDLDIMLPDDMAATLEAHPARRLTYVRVLKMHFLRGEPFNLAEVYVAADVYKRIPPDADAKAKVSRLIRDFGNVKIVRNRQEVTIARADSEVAARFGCPVGDILVRIRRWRTDNKGDLIFAAVNLYRGDLFVLDIVDEDPNDLRYRSGLLPGEITNHARSLSHLDSDQR